MVPRVVDMSDLDGLTKVRVDVTTRRYDVRDLLKFVLKTDGAVKAASKMLGHDYGAESGSIERLRWNEGKHGVENRGKHRLVATAAACVAMLHKVMEGRARKQRGYDHALQIVEWLEQRALLDDPVPVHPE